MFIDDPSSYRYPPPQIKVSDEIVEYCDYFTVDAERGSLRHLDCIYYNMGYYGNDPEMLKKDRQRVRPIFK